MPLLTDVLSSITLIIAQVLEEHLPSVLVKDLLLLAAHHEVPLFLEDG